MTVSKFWVYGPAMEAIKSGAIDLDGDDFRLVLVTESYTPNQSAHAAWSSISANEVAAGGGYATHGRALDASVSRDGLVSTFNMDGQTWPEATITAKYAVIVRDASGNGELAAGDIPICYCDLQTEGGSVSSTNANFTVNPHADGVFRTVIEAAS